MDFVLKYKRETTNRNNWSYDACEEDARYELWQAARDAAFKGGGGCDGRKNRFRTD